MVDIELLRKFSLFKDLDDPQLEKLAGHIKERRYAHGDIICSQGDQGDEIFFIKRGAVSVVLPLYRFDSQYKTVSEIGPGEFFGELSFFDGKERSANIRSKGILELLVLSRQDYDKVVKENLKEGCQIQSKIIAGLVGMIREMNEAYSSAGFLV